MATLEWISSTSTTITVKITGLDDSYNNRQRTVFWGCGTAYPDPPSTAIPNKRKETDPITLSGFSAGKTYTINGNILYYGYVDGKEESFTKPISCKAKTRPSKFSWEYSDVAQGKDAIKSATDLNNLTQNINEVRAYRKANGYTVSSPTEYSFTTAVKGHDITADMFNELLHAIKGISGYGTWFRDFDSGEECTAQLLNSVVTELNTIP